jgi:hypothetical protein
LSLRECFPVTVENFSRSSHRLPTRGSPGESRPKLRSSAAGGQESYAAIASVARTQVSASVALTGRENR